METIAKMGTSELADSEVLPARRSDLFVLPCGEDFMVHDESGKSIHVLNPVAGAILDQCDGETMIQALVVKLRETYDVDEETLCRDVRCMLCEFREKNLLEAP